MANVTVLFNQADWGAYSTDMVTDQAPGTYESTYIKATYTEEFYADKMADTENPWPEHFIVSQDGDDVKVANCSI